MSATLKAPSHVFLAIVLLAAGVLMGRSWSSGASSTANAVERQQPPRAGKAAAGAVPATSDRHDFDSLRLRWQKNDSKPDDLRAGLKRLSAAALRDLALEQQQAMTGASEEDAPAHKLLLAAALEELWSRQGAAALEWAAGLESKEARGALSCGLLENALGDDPATAKPWVRKFHDEFGKSETNNQFLTIAMRGAAARSAEDVIHAYGMFSGTNLSNPLYEANYADDFDFAKLYTALGSKTDLSHAISVWAQRDRDAVWTAVSGSSPRSVVDSHRWGHPVEPLMKAAIAKDGETVGVAWVMERLSTLTPEERTLQLSFIDPRGELSADGAAAIAASLPQNERARYATALVKQDGVSAKSYAVLDTLPRADLVAALHTDLRGSNQQLGPPPGTADFDAYMDRIAAEVQDRYDLTEEEMSGIGGR